MLRWQRNIRDGGRWGGGEEEQTVALTTQHTGRWVIAASPLWLLQGGDTGAVGVWVCG